MTPLRLKLRELRKEAGLTQQQLAKLAGMQQNEISRIENQPTMISMKVLDRLCDALACGVEDLLERQPMPRKRRRR